MSTRERLPIWGIEIDSECFVFQADSGFAVSFADCWLPGVYQTFEAAEMAFQLSDEQLCSLRYRVHQRGYHLITLYDIESLL